MNLTINQRRILAVLEQLVAEGAMCPTNADLADRIGADTADAAKVLGSLRTAGVIDVLTIGKRRQITIVATGAKTAAIDVAAGAVGSNRLTRT